MRIGIINSSALENSLLILVISLNLTRASPIEAVTSKMFKSKYLSIVETNLNAIFKPPPTISDTKLTIANIPLNVLTNFLPFSLSSPVFLSVSLRLVVNLWKAAITLNNCSGLIFSNVSPQAFPIALNTPISPLPIFLNELINNQRPVILSILSMNSLSGIPNLSAVSPRSATLTTVFSIVSDAFLAGSTIFKSLSERLVNPVSKALFNNVFLASDILLINSPSTSLIPVHSSFASSKSPIMSRHV